MLTTSTKYYNDGFKTTLYENRKRVMVIVMYECEGRNIWELLVPHDYFGEPAMRCKQVAFTKITNTKHEVLAKKAEKRIVELYTIKKVIFKYDAINGTYLIDDKEVNKDTWIKAKSTWETEQSYNHIKKYVDEWGFTSHDYYIEDNNINVWEFTTIKK